MHKPVFLNDERAVSDVIGFILVFGLIITTVSLVYVVGFSSLDNARAVEERKNAERAFDILADNINDVVEGNAPTRGTEIKVGDAKLYGGGSVFFTVNVTDSSVTNSKQIEAVPLIYETPSGQQVIYINGAVLRSQVGGSSFIIEPGIDSEHDAFIMPLIETRIPSDSASGVSGGTYLVRTHSASQSAVAYNKNSYTVDFRIDTPRTAVWERYCDRHPELSIMAVNDGDFVRCGTAGNFDAVFLQHERVETRII
jgi:hypothetical protein